MSQSNRVRRVVPADLIESTPSSGGVGQWVLASPLLLFLAWLWVDAVQAVSPLSSFWLNALFGLPIFAVLIVLPLGYVTHRGVLGLPWLFHNAGWDVAPLEPVPLAEQYLVRYRYQARHWAATNWRRAWLRAGQGWVFLEIAVILVGAVAMIPLYFSAVELGFGQ
jgi:hypothetical protein